MLNPFYSVRGQKHAAVEGKTAEISIEQARALLRTIDVSHGNCATTRTTPTRREDFAMSKSDRWA